MFIKFPSQQGTQIQELLILQQKSNNVFKSVTSMNTETN